MAAEHGVQSLSESPVRSGLSPDMQDFGMDLNTFKETLAGGENPLLRLPNDVFDVSTQGRNESSTNLYGGTQISHLSDDMEVDAPNDPCLRNLAPDFTLAQLYEKGLAIQTKNSHITPEATQNSRTTVSLFQRQKSVLAWWVPASPRTHIPCMNLYRLLGHVTVRSKPQETASLTKQRPKKSSPCVIGLPESLY